MDTSPVIRTALGQVRGVKRTTIYDDSYFSFEGIPFGKPPLGDLRFRAPQPVDPWTGIRDCSVAGNKPLQMNSLTGQIVGSEDCLYLNLYVKTLTPKQPLPVMVWIYGGGFHMGEGSRASYGPDYFMQQDVILVCPNYRLCSLGFLSLADPDLQVPGNAGLKDQVLVLKWIKQNIVYFNGDENNVTVFGQSAGGACAHYLGISEQSRGLFHKFILMSGTALNSWANIPQPHSAYRLAKQNGFEGENTDRQVLCYLRGLEAGKLVKHDLVTEEYRRNSYYFVFGPTIEPYLSENCVIPRKPLDMVRTAWGNAIPMILGRTTFEGLIMYRRIKLKPEVTERLKTDPESVLPVEVRETRSAEERPLLAGKIIYEHFGDKEPGAQTLFEHLHFYSNKLFSHDIHRVALSRTVRATAPTYLYRFAFDSPDFNAHRARFCGKDPVRGVAHADDLSYLFYLPESWKLTSETPEYKTIQRMIGMWTAFAKSSDPNCAAIKPAVWHPLQQDSPKVALNICGDDVDMMQIPEALQMELWDSLYKIEDLH